MNEETPSTVLEKKISKGKRLGSLDFYRGLIMVLLMVEASGLYYNLAEVIPKGSWVHSIVNQFFHADWEGLHFWDLIQPGFMFIAGVAMTFSLTKQATKGVSWKKQAKHALKRSFWLFFWGVLDYAVVGDHITFELWNVLTQLSFTMLVAFFIFRWKIGLQIAFSVGLLLLTELLYRTTQIPGFTKPFVDQQNFGNYVDLILMNKTNPGGWVAINAIPTACHTIWGMIAGRWLISKSNYIIKIRNIVLFGVIIAVAGYLMHWTQITPMIKRIATSSFTLVSGGWCLFGLAFLFWWIDVLGKERFINFFIIVGMNSIFIYLFFEIVVRYWLNDYWYTLTTSVLELIGVGYDFRLIFAALTLFGFQWYLCYWLYQKKIFFKV